MSAVASRGPLHGVVSLLDAGATMMVKGVWSELERDFGLRGVLVMPYPHFSYQVARGYDREAVEAELARLSQELAPFEVRTVGLATFEGDWPVVYVAVKKDRRLRSLQELVWNRCLPHAREALSYYRPDVWVPHITLAHGEEQNSVSLAEEQVRAVVGSLNGKEFRWTISVDNLALVWDTGSSQGPVRTFPLRGR